MDLKNTHNLFKLIKLINLNKLCVFFKPIYFKSHIQSWHLFKYIYR